MTGFSDDQLSALRAPLARDHVKSRQQAGRTLSYVEGWVVVAEANRIFGFDAWDRETVECRCVAERESKLGPNKDRDGWRVAYVGRVRVKIRAGDQVIMREGTGYGSGIDADLGEAHESAAKECETDAMKRALMTFGNPFGLALYDKAQTEVEPATNARRQAGAPAVPATPAVAPTKSTAPTNGSTVPATTADDRARAKTIRDRIKAEIEAAMEPVIVDEILRVNRVDLEFLDANYGKNYDDLMMLAIARSNELRASA